MDTTVFFQSGMVLLAIFSLISTFVAFRKCQSKTTILARPYRACELMGSFVWADHSIFGPFWFFVSAVTFLLNDYLLFLLIVSVFWLVRSTGEMIYWFLQQFHPRVGNEPQKFWINRHVPGEAVWFIHQIVWQCIIVLTFITTILLSYLWLSRLN